MSFFDFSDLSDAQVNEYKNPNFLVKEDECDFKVLESSHHTSKSTGNKSVKLVIEITDTHQKKAKVFDYLGVEKLIKFMNFYGFEDDIRNKTIDIRKLVGVRGKLKNKHRINERDGEKENSIHYYINPKAASRTETSSVSNVSRESLNKNQRNDIDDFGDSDIPF